MDITTIVNIILSLLSFLLATISIIFVVITIRQNSQMIEENTRPNISIYLGTTSFQETNVYLIIKNFGSSSGVITDFKCNINLLDLSYDEKTPPFRSIIGTNIAPGQSLRYPINRSWLSKNDSPECSFVFSYKSIRRTYNENVIINWAAHTEEFHIRANTKDRELRTVSFALLDIAEKML